jgi:antitoxin VapB
MPYMALSIKNDSTEALARQVAEETGESITKAIEKSLQERLARLKARRRNRALATQLDEILARVDQLPMLDPRPADEILGYDEHGLPR